MWIMEVMSSKARVINTTCQVNNGHRHCYFIVVMASKYKHWPKNFLFYTAKK